MVVLVSTQPQPVLRHLSDAIRAMTDETTVTVTAAALVQAIQVISHRAVGLILTLRETEPPAATMEVKLWGMQSLRVLFHNPDLTEGDFVAALETGALHAMVASIPDDQVFILRIRIGLSTFNGIWEKHVNHLTRTA